MSLHNNSFCAATSSNVFCAGCLFCMSYRFAGNLWFPIAIHFVWNFLLGSVLGLVVSGQSHLGKGSRILNLDGPALFTGGAFGLEGGLIVTFTTRSEEHTSDSSHSSI